MINLALLSSFILIFYYCSLFYFDSKYFQKIRNPKIIYNRQLYNRATLITFFFEKDIGLCWNLYYSSKMKISGLANNITFVKL